MKNKPTTKCSINSKINKTKSYSFCTQCMDMPIIDEEGYCDICNALVDDEKERELFDSLYKEKEPCL